MSSRALPLLALLLAVGIFFAYVRPTWQGPIAASKASIAANDQALQAAADYRTRENQLAAERSRMSPESLTRLSMFLPDSVDNVRIILDLNALAARSGLNLTSINVASSDTETGSGSASASVGAPVTATAGTPGAGALPTSNQQHPVGSVDLSLTTVGSYDAFQDFLTALEKSARLLDVQDLSVEGSETGVYTYELNVRLYWLR